ncbi:MAG: DUF1203 domain-containing protein [Alphaproteobacteria bacterium]|nr:DUF1203 domain-containing protein [Alphaproteobacteria bacterium]MBU1513988.1 DUF1203 domain-containing protein [Alphaproteobacteria bacterium]MBU2093072.1 DUF1203 domain-containing protein [Alphaproteobacteria bacterium]MBU2151725.1 DUF1203 domain-containing protein [Alphaproteobacteria bacterium]MBU2309455.1 DUF1203 domain-containing protein [Alphaproteobacteria bacterium]
MSFVVSALPMAPFRPLFDLSDAELTQRGIVRRTVEGPGAPCRVTLQDAEPGETVLLLNYEHQPADTPFRSRHAIFVRKDAADTTFAPGEIPPAFSARQFLSLRAFDEAGMMIDADLVPTIDLETAIPRLLADSQVAYLHAHYPGAGCFAARIDRS